MKAPGRCAVVLCGGAGTRLGGVDKPLLAWHGKPLIDHVIERLRPQVDQLCISANRNLDQYRRRAPLVVDAQPSVDTPSGGDARRNQEPERPGQGPLAGVLAAARWYAANLPAGALKATWLLICPGDSPRIPLDLGELLARPGIPLTYVDDGQRLQPLHALARLDKALTVAAYLSGGNRSVRGWLDAQAAQPVLVPDPNAFCNINTSEDFGPPEPPD
jgi:molybdopterin-guanine dinucleotide biosynthesis protein A